MKRSGLVLFVAVCAALAACDRLAKKEPKRDRRGSCEQLPSADDLRRYLRDAPAQGGDAGGLAHGQYAWAAVVNRAGEICSAAVSTPDPATAWPGSQAIAKAKAYTANAFSTDLVPQSTARLYTMAQPGHSLYGVANGNPFNALCLKTPDDPADDKVCGGTIAFGGGLPL
jgi:hypothetical protein